MGVSTNNECERKPFSHIPNEACQIDSSDDEDNSYVVDHRSSKECGSSNSKYRTPLPKEIVESLMNGELVDVENLTTAANYVWRLIGTCFIARGQDQNPTKSKIWSFACFLVKLEK
ncbi:unnamed protein product [Camellia sinensis]